MSRSSQIAQARKPLSDTPIVGLLAGLGGNFSRLFRQEIALARAEVTEKVTQAGVLNWPRCCLRHRRILRSALPTRIGDDSPIKNFRRLDRCPRNRGRGHHCRWSPRLDRSVSAEVRQPHYIAHRTQLEG
jgi:hypothetical protein